MFNSARGGWGDGQEEVGQAALGRRGCFRLWARSQSPALLVLLDSPPSSSAARGSDRLPLPKLEPPPPPQAAS